MLSSIRDSSENKHFASNFLDSCIKFLSSTWKFKLKNNLEVYLKKTDWKLKFLLNFLSSYKFISCIAARQFQCPDCRFSKFTSVNIDWKRLTKPTSSRTLGQFMTMFKVHMPLLPYFPQKLAKIRQFE